MLEKLQRICKSSSKAKVFEKYYNDTKCIDILEATNLCNGSDAKPIHAEMLKNPEMAKFVYKYAKENVAVINAYIKDPYYTLIRRDESVPMTTFLGGVGGTLGLLVGINVISLYEIFYHLATYIYQNLLAMTSKSAADKVEKFQTTPEHCSK